MFFKFLLKSLGPVFIPHSYREKKAWICIEKRLKHLSELRVVTAQTVSQLNKPSLSICSIPHRCISHNFFFALYRVILRVDIFY